MLTPRVTVVGSLNADLTLPVDHLPGRGETVLSSVPGHVAFGGKGGNQACGAAAFGASVTMIGRVGDDDPGRAIIADLAGRGIDVSGVRVMPGTRTGSATIAVDGAGDNLIIVDPGANSRLGPQDVRAGLAGGAAVTLLQLEIPLATVLAAVEPPAAR